MTKRDIKFHNWCISLDYGNSCYEILNDFFVIRRKSLASALKTSDFPFLTIKFLCLEFECEKVYV